VSLSTRPTALPYHLRGPTVILASYALLRSCPLPGLTIISTLGLHTSDLACHIFWLTSGPYAGQVTSTSYRYLPYAQSTLPAHLLYGTSPAVPFYESLRQPIPRLTCGVSYGRPYVTVPVPTPLPYLPRPTAGLRHPTAFLIRNQIAVPGPFSTAVFYQSLQSYDDIRPYDPTPYATRPPRLRSTALRPNGPYYVLRLPTAIFNALRFAVLLPLTDRIRHFDSALQFAVSSWPTRTVC